MVSYKSSQYVNDSESDSEVENMEFQPPKGFNKFTPSKKFTLSGDKEVWLIKTPKGFPLNELKTLPVSFTSTTISNGPSTFKLDKKTFQANEELFSADGDNRKYSLFSNEDLKKYKNLPKEISRIYNISENVEIPEINFDKVVVPRKDVKKIKNLRMRHFATGYGAKDFKEADPNFNHESESEASDNEDVEAGKVVKKAKVEKKEKEEKEEKKAKKDKKEKKEKKEKKNKKEKKHKKD